MTLFGIGWNMQGGGSGRPETRQNCVTLFRTIPEQYSWPESFPPPDASKTQRPNAAPTRVTIVSKFSDS